MFDLQQQIVELRRKIESLELLHKHYLKCIAANLMLATATSVSGAPSRHDRHVR